MDLLEVAVHLLNSIYNASLIYSFIYNKCGTLTLTNVSAASLASEEDVMRFSSSDQSEDCPACIGMTNDAVDKDVVSLQGSKTGQQIQEILKKQSNGLQTLQTE